MATAITMGAPVVASASNVNVFLPGPYEQNGRSTASFEAAGGETNTVTATRSGDSLIFTDPGSNITAAPACTVSADKHMASCPNPSQGAFDLIVMNLGDGNDSGSCDVTAPFDTKNFAMQASGAAGDDTINGCDVTAADDFFGGDFLQGGTGSDTIRGRAGDDTLRDRDFNEPGQNQQNQQGGGGDDHFFGGAGEDDLEGGLGNDELRGEDGDDGFTERIGDGNDTIDGAGGLDFVTYNFVNEFDGNNNPVPIAPDRAGATISLDTPAARATTGNGFPGENDTISFVEDATGSAGADNITGSTAGNVIFGGSGNDAITGGAGSDNLSGQGGDDTINAQDGQVDRVSCGTGADKANVDNVDQVSGDCPAAGAGTTVVNVPPPPGPVVIRDPKDTAPAVISGLKASKKVKYATLRKNGKYKFSFKVNEVVTGEFTLSGKLGSKGRIATAGYLTLAEKRQTIAANKTTTVTVTIPKSARKALRKGKSIRLLLNLRDAGGNITAKRVTIKLS